MNKRKYQIVLKYIKKELKTGRISFGDRLPAERKLAEDLGVSRATVSEAIKIMEIMGLIETTPGGGNYFVQKIEKVFHNPLSSFYIVDETVEEKIIEFRRVLESNIIDLCIKNITEEDLIDMENILGELSKDKTQDELVMHDNEFHKKIVTASKNPFAIGIYNSISEMLQESIKISRNRFISIFGKETVEKHHEEIFLAIKNKDVNLAKARILKHLDYIENTLPKEN